MKNQNVVLKVNDMHCESCPKLIKLTLTDINGVNEVATSLETKTVVVDFDPGKTSTAEIINSIGEIGYTATLN